MSSKIKKTLKKETEVDLGDEDDNDNESIGSSECNDWSEDTDEIDNELSTMTFEELMKLKEELGSKVYKEAVFGAPQYPQLYKKMKSLKRLNKNRPREMSSKKQVPFFGGFQVVDSRTSSTRDPRFEKESGDYNPKKFKEDYKFLMYVRKKEIADIKKKISEAKDSNERKKLSFVMLRLNNKNVEEQKWHAKQSMLKREQKEIEKAKKEGKKPHYLTKKERRAKELVHQFDKLKAKGKLDKHLEKKRKKNAAKDRKKMKFDI